MLKRVLFLILILFFCGNVSADYILDRRTAMELLKAGRQDEALAAFQKMGIGEVSDFQKSDALEQAAMCAHRLKRDEEAADLAARIPLIHASKTCQIRLLAEHRKWAEILAQFKDEKFASWPDDYAAEAFYLRGQARYFLNDGEGAAADLRQAADLSPDNGGKGRAALALGVNYRNRLKDEEQALLAYEQTVAWVPSGGHYVPYTAAVSAAAILRSQGKHERALAMALKFDADKAKGYWRGMLLVSQAETLAAQGKKEEAAVLYKKAIAVEGLTESDRKEWEKRFLELERN